MNESAKWKLGGAAMIVLGLGLILFGGSKSVNGSYFEIFGFSFNWGESEPMSRWESWFWGIALIIGGVLMIKWLG